MMQNKILASLLFCFIFPFPLFSQSVYAPLNPDYYHLVERYEIKYGKFADGFHSHVKPYSRKGIAQLVDSVAANLDLPSNRDRFNFTYLRNDNWEWTDSAQNESKIPIFKKFYRKNSDLFHYQEDDFEVHVNPVLYFGLGLERNQDRTTFINTRGLEVRGMISKKLGFYTFLADNQATFPAYTRSRINFFNAVPNEGFWKRYSNDGVDFITARGYFTFTPIKHIQVQFGHDKNFIGNGYRSMILSDYSNNYLFLKLQTQVWRLQYTNLFAQMNGNFVATANQTIPKKYFAFHHLSVNITKNFNLGLFESVVYGSPDGGYDLNYLNPIIFYRSVEQQSGSYGNALLGADFKLNFLRRFSLYGQLMLDEFLLKEVRAGNGWWANKHGVQLGLKYIDVAGIKNLDMQMEFNVARPFTYSHASEYTNYTHYSQPLAHPLGANFREAVGVIRLQPLNRLRFSGTAVYAEYGTDPTSTQNYGGNVLLSYVNRTQEYGNRIGQGVKNYLFFLDLTASIMIMHNVFIDAKQVVRRLNTDGVAPNNTVFSSIALRWNIPQRQQTF